eukprot:TRINITY_DN1245_c3_g1_i1.p1 TRINITY_DN1245_c3_g1~~TRINITY_DN1245_c3_g1_i1.p1  ORF type:complete len:326 (-),score=35.90 TRINITY_DN1245_c3_g1_i1:30-1007(-)
MEKENIEEEGETSNFTKGSLVPRYKIYPSDNKFLFFGFCISGPDRLKQYRSIFMILIPSIIFFIYTCPFLIRLQFEFGIITLVISFCWSLLCIIFILITGNMDPGIVPRQTDIKEENPFNTLPRFREHTINNKKIQVKWCNTCHIFRPPRSNHCRLCDNCVEIWDHHCPWVGNCIGKRNYKFYLYFIWSTMLFAIYITLNSIVHIVLIGVRAGSFPQALLDIFLYSSLSFFVMIYCGYGAISLSILVIVHSNLLLKNQTTAEFLKYVHWRKKKFNPYYVGVLLYSCRACCGKLYSTSVDWHELVDPEEESNKERTAYPPNIVWPA